MKKYGILIIMLLLLSGCASSKYTIRIVNNNGELLSSFEVASGGNINNIDEPSMDGYIFVSLLKDGVIYDKSSPIYEDMTLEASFVKVPEITNNYTISFDFGDEVKTQTVKEGDKVIEPVEPKKNKYKFLGLTVGLVIAGMNPTEAIEAIGKYVQHLHISDHGPLGDCLRIGNGRFQIVPFLAMLRKKRFDGTVTLELYRDAFEHAQELCEDWQRLDRLIARAQTL